ncbi:TonB-dependent receptor [Sphingosinicella rhizophila]|uniref:TonB-dependent receptor n=1 Tax=Sphingosinicella rhizophila TaxID=3050082 RepID=A0ABU3QBZ6_9SPHN|nr:TonB-dependent receptor [Sphingosinicella sp. GR2756]MDT9600664.1 TonB-dependent receptor [Sphingosinicella sp. GR2756]
MLGSIFMSSGAALVVPAGSAAHAQSAAVRSFDIPAQPLDAALKAFARQSRQQLLYSPALVAGLTSSPLKGRYAPADGLQRLLQGSGVQVRTAPSGAFLLSANEAGEAALAQGGPSVEAYEAPQEDIIVTATKRAEPVRRISGSVSAQTGEQLDKIGAQSLADYLGRTPGVVLNATNPGDSAIVMRGISTTTNKDQGQATTGIFINDVPLTDPTFSIGTPDIDTFDIDNVTVLRGPQGTLFGSASLGGAINYQANLADVDGWDVRAQATLSDTRHGGTGGSAKGMVNVPIVDGVFAVRGVLVYREDAGYIDNIGTGIRNSNRTITKGGRFLAGFKPGPDTSINYMYLEQNQENEDAGFQAPETAGRLRKSTLFPDTSRFNTRIHNLRIDQEFDFGTLTATATHHRKTYRGDDDYTAVLTDALFGLAPILSYSDGHNSGKTFEVRLASAPGGAFDYVIGAMHDNTRVNVGQSVTAAGLEDLVDVLFGPGSGAVIAPGDLVVAGVISGRAKESAIFGEGSYHFGDQWKITLGGRLFDQKLRLTSVGGGLLPFLSGAPLDLEGVQKSSGFNPKASITFTPDRDLMVYALVSKGFRFGGPNIIPAVPGSNVPQQYESDSLWNYEVGMRADLLDRKLLLDLTAFYIDWSNIQLRLTSNSLNYADNAGKARSYGLEASATLRPAPGVSLISSATYLNAKLSEPFDPDQEGPGAEVPAGSTLPGASKWQLSNIASYDFSRGNLDWTFLLSHRYISKAPGGLVVGSLLTGATQGGYHLLAARAGVRRDRIGLTLFVDNIADSHGVTGGTADPIQQYIVRPRTFGITLDYRM